MGLLGIEPRTGGLRPSTRFLVPPRRGLLGWTISSPVLGVARIVSEGSPNPRIRLPSRDPVCRGCLLIAQSPTLSREGAWSGLSGCSSIQCDVHLSIPTEGFHFRKSAALPTELKTQEVL